MTGVPGAVEVLADALDDPDETVRRHAAVALGRRGSTATVPLHLAMVVEGTDDVDATEIQGTLSEDPEYAGQIMTALVGEIYAHSTEPAARIRMTQALVEIPGVAAADVLRRLADDDRSVAALLRPSSK